MTLPEYFVWTRYGTESGEAVESILARKEHERQAAGGMFLWGIGNSVAPSVRKLLVSLKGRDPYVVFSPMLAAPRAVDVSPAEVVAWQSARGIDEQEWEMPDPAADGAVEVRDVIERVRAKLSAEHRQVVDSYVLDGHSARETAEQVPGMTEANVHQIGSRFRSALKAELRDGDTEER